MSQEELQQLVGQRDPRALSVLYSRYSRSLYSVIANLIKDRTEAEDILRETFVRIWNDIHTYDESKGLLYSWMLKMARTAAIEKLQSKGRTLKDLDGSFVSLVQDERLMKRVDSIGISEFVRKLKPRCIQIIELLFYRGYSEQEAAEMLEIPTDSVKTKNRSCVNDLRTYMDI